MFCSCLCLSFGILLGAEERHFYLVGNSTEKYKNIPFSSKWWEIPLVATPCRCPQQFGLAQDRPLEFLLPKIRKSQWPLTSRPRIMTFRMTSPIEGLSHGTICITIGYKMAWQYPNLRSHAKVYFCRSKCLRFIFGSYGNFFDILKRQTPAQITGQWHGACFWLQLKWPKTTFAGLSPKIQGTSANFGIDFKPQKSLSANVVSLILLSLKQFANEFSTFVVRRENKVNVLRICIGTKAPQNSPLYLFFDNWWRFFLHSLVVTGVLAACKYVSFALIYVDLREWSKFNDI